MIDNRILGKIVPQMFKRDLKQFTPHNHDIDPKFNSHNFKNLKEGCFNAWYVRCNTIR